MEEGYHRPPILLLDPNFLNTLITLDAGGFGIIIGYRGTISDILFSELEMVDHYRKSGRMKRKGLGYLQWKNMTGNINNYKLAMPRILE